MSNKIELIAISGTGLSGKDSLYLILEKIFKKNNIITDRIGLADPLKYEINDFCKSQYGISSFTKDAKEKELIRPLMVVHGKIKRTKSNGRYFTDLAQSRLEENKKNNILTIVTDIRYAQFSEDEIYWVNKNNGVLIHVERTLPDGQLIQPANLDEEKNNPVLKSAALHHLSWQTTDDLDVREDFVKFQLNKLINKVINERK